MNPTLKNVLAVVAGIVLGMVVNGTIVMLSSKVVPFPEGVTPENVMDNLKLFEAKHWVMPWLAHALGTLAAAFFAAKFVSIQKMKIALGVGIFFLLMGTINIFIMKGTPIWFIILDLVGAYIPTAWLGGRMASDSKRP